MKICMQGHVMNDGEVLCPRCNMPEKLERVVVPELPKEEPKEEPKKVSKKKKKK